MAGITDCVIQFIFKPSANNNSNGVTSSGLVHYNGTHCHLNSFHGFRAVTAALETKGPPIENRYL
jgi:hypothetical protein